jgi:hypothetical protein
MGLVEGEMEMGSLIKTGDKFIRNGVTFEVIETRPGGKVELFDRKGSRFVTRLHKEVRQWERA